MQGCPGTRVGLRSCGRRPRRPAASWQAQIPVYGAAGRGGPAQVWRPTLPDKARRYWTNWPLSLESQARSTEVNLIAGAQPFPPAIAARYLDRPAVAENAGAEL